MTELDAETLARIEEIAGEEYDSTERRSSWVTLLRAVTRAVREERTSWQVQTEILLERANESRTSAETAERELAEAREAIFLLDSIIRRVQRATGDYLPPDWIEARDALNRIIEATDGPEQRKAQSLPAVRAALADKEGE